MAIVSNNTTDVEEPAGAVRRLGAWFLLKQQFTLTTAPHHPGPHRCTPPCFPSLLLTHDIHSPPHSLPPASSHPRSYESRCTSCCSAPIRRTYPRNTGSPPEQRRTPRATRHHGLRRLLDDMHQGGHPAMRSRGPPGDQWRRRHPDKLLLEDD
jgi:hypothetical protein